MQDVRGRVKEQTKNVVNRDPSPDILLMGKTEAEVAEEARV